jgi:hypothetical protein
MPLSVLKPTLFLKKSTLLLESSAIPRSNDRCGFIANTDIYSASGISLCNQIQHVPQVFSRDVPYIND